MAYFNHKTKLKDGRDVLLRAYSYMLLGGSATLGCHSQVVTSAGTVSIIGARIEGKETYGSVGPISAHAMEVSKLAQLAKEAGGWKELRNLVWEGAVIALRGGVYLFSDRINRGTYSSSTPSSAMFGDAPLNTGAFGAWLESRPDLGKTVTSPIFNNPNHHSATDFGLMKIWMFFPTNAERHIAFDEKEGLKPLHDYYTKVFPTEKEPEKKIYITYR